MTEREFENYLILMGKMLRLDESQREAISDELDDHLEQRLEELISRGMEHEDAIRTALEELGDAAGLASRFTQVSRNSKRRWAMRMTMGGLATAAIVMMAFSLWGPKDNGVTPNNAVAQSDGKPRAPIGASSISSTADSKTEAVLSQPTSIEFVQMPFTEVFHELSKQHGVNIIIDNAALEDSDLGSADQRDVNFSLEDISLETAMNFILDEQGLTFLIRDGVIVITTPEAAEEHLVLRFYDVHELVDRKSRGESGIESLARELLKLELGEGYERWDSRKSSGLNGDGMFGGLDQRRSAIAKRNAEQMIGQIRGEYGLLIDIIVDLINSESWLKGGGQGSIKGYKGSLIIAQTRANHKKVEQFLTELRARQLHQPGTTPSAK